MRTLILILILCSPAVAQTPDFNFCAEPWRASVPRQLKATDIHYVRPEAERRENSIVIVCVGQDAGTESQWQQTAASYGWYFCTAETGSGGSERGFTGGWPAGVHHCKVVNGELMFIRGPNNLPPAIYPAEYGHPGYQPAITRETFTRPTYNLPNYRASDIGLNPIGTINADGSRTVGYGQPFYVGQAQGSFGGFQSFGGFSAADCFGGT